MTMEKNKIIKNESTMLLLIALVISLRVLILILASCSLLLKLTNLKTYSTIKQKSERKIYCIKESIAIDSNTYPV